MLFSVITINLNDKAGLERTLRTVFEQSCKNFECIVVDGCSIDGSVDVINSFEKFIDEAIIEKDSGIYDAMNKGLALSNGQYVIFMNSGDEFATVDVLADVAAEINQSKKTPIGIIGPTIEVRVEGSEFVKSAKSPSYSWFNTPTRQQSMFYHGDVARSEKYDSSFKYVGDVDFSYRVFRHKKNTILTMKRPISRFFQGGASYTNDCSIFIENYNLRKKMGFNMLASFTIASIRAIIRFKSRLL